ncbi:hypothetical protein H8A95_37695 [Bradyrhizobium sp. Pear76]|uniref:hypothetical protein n=1 Tax=Bradyrhizobium oropedii TaxID=1571201 RepID=UPI001E5383A4|nr:hypothetical protein [Bradyrhizobium oropedii]MCC8967894.1 hypothetical protein [Bradyrhizobium oropedii]
MAVTTEEEANDKICPHTFHIVEIRGDDGVGIREGGPWSCRGSRCMAWRWRDPKPKLREPRTFWPDTEEPKELRSKRGPERAADVPANAEWIPMVGGEKDNDWAGGFWEEPRDIAEQEFTKACADRRGFCGLVLPPGHES